MGSAMECPIRSKAAKTAAMTRDVDIDVDPDEDVASIKRVTDHGCQQRMI